MGLAEANPRQLAPTVGKTKVGFTISAVPSSTTDNSATSSTIQTRTDLLGTLKLTAYFPISRSNAPDRHASPIQAFGGFQNYIK